MRNINNKWAKYLVGALDSTWVIIYETSQETQRGTLTTRIFGYLKGGYSPITSDTDVPPVRAGFFPENSLKAGVVVSGITVKTGFVGKIGR